jgi:hypothetical protein
VRPVFPDFVIPAQAGIHHLPLKFEPQVMARRLRDGNG